MYSKPIIGITMGDPCGNGPEISVKALCTEAVHNICRPLIIGDSLCMEYAVSVAETIGAFRLGQVRIHPISRVKDALFAPNIIDVLELGQVKNLEERVFGKPSVLGGRAAYRYVEKAIELAMNGELEATVTNALSKEAINMAGYHYAGHTEIYAALTGCKSYAMMLAHKNLRVVHVSTHVSLAEACRRVKKERVLECIKLADEACRALGISQPKVAVAGLNPHCGENGLFGTEEIEEIQPAIEQAIKQGVLIPDAKPLAPDSVFSKALGGWYDVVVVMYHDQGHIPLKVKGFEYDSHNKCWKSVEGINATLGLPIIRVSVDHGTGFGHAGSGYASEDSLVNAIKYAVEFAKNVK